jgi:hypothetical protein
VGHQIIELPKHEVVAPPPSAVVPTGVSETAVPPLISIAARALPARWSPPIFGSLAVIFGVAALFTGTLVLAPLALVMAVAAGLLRQTSWAVIGAASAIVALTTSKYFWALLAVVWLVDRLSWLWNWLI